MTLSQVAQSISESATLKLNALAARLRVAGEPIIHLGGGEPVSKAPEGAIREAVELIQTGAVRYTPPDGIPALKKEIIRYTEQFYGGTFRPENVMASGGTKQAIMVALQAILNPGDEALFAAPYWVSYPEMAKLALGVPVVVDVPEGTFEPRVADFEKRITPRTRAVIINSPNNPTGAVYSEAFMAGLVELCERRGLFLISDDIYHRLVFDGHPPCNLLQFAKDRSESARLLIVNGASKQYAMTGFRIGWAVTHNSRLIAAMSSIQGHQTSGPSVIAQVAAVGAMQGEQRCVDDLRSSLEQSRNALLAKLAAFKRLRVIRPGGTFFVFPDFRGYEPSSHRLAHFLLEKVKVVTVPGVEFGAEGRLRLSFCGGLDETLEGVERIRWALDETTPRARFGQHEFVRDW
ncbi:Aspartate aminotransferase [Phycisphaerae bacterium RAS1]|nr:Aspartate aminotransferase [Phycisphaerae bacterium RAS1]